MLIDLSIFIDLFNWGTVHHDFGPLWVGGMATEYLPPFKSQPPTQPQNNPIFNIISWVLLYNMILQSNPTDSLCKISQLFTLTPDFDQTLELMFLENTHLCTDWNYYKAQLQLQLKPSWKLELALLFNSPTTLATAKVVKPM